MKRLLEIAFFSCLMVATPPTNAGASTDNMQAWTYPLVHQVDPTSPTPDPTRATTQGWNENDRVMIRSSNTSVQQATRVPTEQLAGQTTTVTVASKNVAFSRSQNTLPSSESGQATSGNTESFSAPQMTATDRLTLQGLDSLGFDLDYGYLTTGQGIGDSHYMVNRQLYDFNTLNALPLPTAPGPITVGATAQPVAASQPLDIVTTTAWNWVHQTTVATPQPHVQAGRGIPGLLTYLETGMSLAMTETVNSPAGPLFLNGTATLIVDWGDGERSINVTDPGAAYPDGRLTHHYPNSGDYTITVTANWLITWQLAGTTGVIPIQTTGTLPDFPVRELRAVARQITG